MQKMKWQAVLTEKLTWEQEYECIRLYDEFVNALAELGRKTGRGSMHWMKHVDELTRGKMEHVRYANFLAWAELNNVEVPEQIEGLHQYDGGWVFEEMECK